MSLNFSWAAEVSGRPAILAARAWVWVLWQLVPGAGYALLNLHCTLHAARMMHTYVVHQNAVACKGSHQGIPACAAEVVWGLWCMCFAGRWEMPL